MPEGPSLVYLKEQLEPFVGRKVTSAGGYAPVETAWIKGKKLLEILTWGKHLLLRFSQGTIRIHLMLFGSVLINKRKKVNASFFLRFGKEEMNFYVVQAKLIEGPLEKVYDWRTDFLSRQWRPNHVKKLVQSFGEQTIGDVLLNQQVFTGVGNIMRIEVLYRCRIHPSSLITHLPDAKLVLLIRDMRVYARQFLKEKKAGIFGKNWEAYEQEYCHRDDIPFKKKILGRVKRKTYYCEECQVKYD